MKIDTQILEDHQARVKVEAEPEQLEAAKRKAARKIAQKTKIPGFRPGKAPYHMVERFVGPGAILEEALELMMEELYPQVLKESGLKPYGPGKLENMPTTEPPTFEFLIPLDAEVKLGDYKAIRIPYDREPINDEDVEKVLENIRQQQAVIEPVDRPTQDGDQVQILMSAERRNPEEGETPILIRERSVPVIIEASGSQNLEEFPFPGFSQQLVGLSAGDEKKITYSYPEDSNYELLRGEETEFTVKVENVKSRTLPELNDELAISHGDYENLDALKADILKHLDEQARHEYDEDYDEKVMQAVLADTEIKYPPQMIEAEQDSLLHNLEHRLEQQNLDLETYLKTRQMDKDALIEELAPVAENRLKKFLTLMEVARAENVQVKTEDVQSGTLQTLEMYTRNMKPQDARKAITREVVNNLAANVTSDLLVLNTQERLRAIAKGEEIPGESQGTEETIDGGDTAANDDVSTENQTTPVAEETSEDLVTGETSQADQESEQDVNKD